MAPKSKGNKKNLDKTADAKTNETNSRPKSVDQPLTEVNKEYYRAQIRDLEHRLEKYQRKCDELEVREQDFSSRYSSLEKEKRDIVLYLKRSLAQRDDELTDLSEQLLGLHQAKEVERESFEKQLAQLRHEFQESRDQLTSENMILAGKLAALEEFRLQKEELTAHLAALEEELEKQRQEHQAVVYDLEKKAVLDNDRLKKEMHQHVAAVAAEFRRISDKKMPETTMRAIHENISVTGQLRKLSGRNQELLRENQGLREKEKQLRRELEILEPLLNEMTRKSLGNQKVIQQLMEKCKQQQREPEESERSHEQRLRWQEDHNALQQNADKLRQELEVAQEEVGQIHAEADRLRKELEAERDLRSQLEKVLQDATIALTRAMKEVPTEEDSEVQILARRNQMMLKLLAVLDSAALLGRGPAPAELMTASASLHKFKTGPGPERPRVLRPLLKATKHLCHYKTGDLGLIPRPGHTHATTLSKMGPLSKSTHFNK